MNRRTALKGLGVAGAVLVVPGIAGGCATTSLATKAWSGPQPETTDTRLRALSYAVLAPNAHNTQPWTIALRGDDELFLYVDRTRLLPETDVPFRQAHVSQGTFLELLVVALSAYGRGAEVTLFPDGEYGSDVVEDRPVARVRVLPGGTTTADPLFSFITERRSNKVDYDPRRALSPEQVARLVRSVAGGATLAVVEEPLARRRLAAIAEDAMAVEVSARARNVETAKWMRFSNAEADAKRDGMTLANNGKTGFVRWVAETFVLSREKSGDPDGAFARGAIDLARSQAESAPAFGVLTTPSNTRTAQVLAGRAYARIALTVQALGLSMHPMSQALEEYPDMAEVKARFEREIRLAPGGTAQMFFRLGYAKDLPPHSPRRDVSALVRT